MRFPVFARRSNASIDRPIMRKSMSYLEAQIAEGVADWVDAGDPRKGIIARGMLYFGARDFQPTETPHSVGYLPLIWRGPIPPWRVEGMIRETPAQCAMLYS